MTTIIAKNVDIIDLLIEELGITIPASMQETLSDLFTLADIADSETLKTHVSGLSIVINDGSQDLSAEEGIRHVSLQSEYEDAVEESGLGGGGQATQAFDAYSAVAQAIGTSWGDLSLDTQRQKTGAFDFTAPSAEVEIATGTTTQRFLVLGRCTTRVTSGTSRSEAELKCLIDTGSGYADLAGTAGEMYLRQLNYGASCSFLAVITLAAGDKLKMQAMRTWGTSTIQAVANGTALVLVALRGEKGDQGPQGDQGIQGDLGPQGEQGIQGPPGEPNWVAQETAPTSPSSGDGWYVPSEGLLYIYDGTRSKWLSVDRQLWEFGTEGLADNEYLQIANQIDDDEQGHTFYRDFTVLGIRVFAPSGNQTKAMAIEKDRSSVHAFSLTAGAYEKSDLDLDFDAGELLQLFVESAGTGARDTHAKLEIAWRKS